MWGLSQRMDNGLSVSPLPEAGLLDRFCTGSGYITQTGDLEREEKGGHCSPIGPGESNSFSFRSCASHAKGREGVVWPS